MPANIFTWADFMKNTPSTPPLDLESSGTPSFEMRLGVGNVVGGPHTAAKPAGEYIAGLAYASQQGANTGTGEITKSDYSTGNILVNTGNPASPAVLQINDPNGRFGRARSPDPRFSVDDQNPTVHAGTGFPMCVPRTTADPTVAGNPDDALCPQSNRPKPVNGQCRNFVGLAVLPKGASAAGRRPGVLQPVGDGQPARLHHRG